MKLHHLLIAAATLLVLPACEKRDTPAGTSKDGINDALDRRPAEGVRDATEDAADAVKDAASEVKEEVKESTN